MVKSTVIRKLAALLFIFSLWTTANAVPLVLSHQGRLLDASDAPLSGTYTIVYSIFDAPVGGTQLWMEDHVGVTVTDGLFSALLGSTVPLSADIVAGSGGGGGGSLRYLQVQISGQPPIMPRTQLVSSPYSLATHRVSGDFQSGPGVVVMGDTTTNNYARFGERVQAGLHAAGSALASGAALIKEECDDGDASVAITSKGTGARVLAIQNGTTPDAVKSSMAIDDDGDTVPENEIENFVAPGTCSVAIKTRGTGADKNRVISGTTTPDSVKLISFVDENGDNEPDGQISNVITPTTCSVAINQKGTGAEKNRTISTGSTLGGVYQLMSVEENGDSSPEGQISSFVTPTTCGVAINQKGTGADKNRTVSSSVNDSSIVHVMEVLQDGVIEPESEIQQSIVPGTSSMAINQKGTGAEKNRVISTATDSSVTHTLSVTEPGALQPQSEIQASIIPGTCSVAIKTKGTGADKNRVIGSSCDDSLSITYLDIDDDGDGISEARAVSSVGNLAGAGGGAAAASYARAFVDSDDDGIPEGDISQIVLPTSSSMAINQKGTGAEKNRVISTATDSSVTHTLSVTEPGALEPQSEIQASIIPGTCSVAIKTRGTGADKNRTIGSSVDDSGAVHYLDMDDDNDGILDRSIVSSVDTGNAQVLLSEGQTELAFRTKKGGVIKGNVVINHDNALRVELNADGNGYLSNALGIGVTPTHHIDVAGGAYCDGTNWVNASDVNSKENFRSVDGEQILEKLEDLEISQWNYKGESGMDHIGPTAQDFKKTFGVGSDGKSISTIDPSGIALAAIQELYAQLKAKDQKLDDQSKLIQQLQAQIAQIRKELEKK